MPRPRKIAAIIFGILLLTFAAIGAFRFFQALTLSRVVRTNSELWLFQAASTNYFTVFKEWPRSIRDLTQNQSNLCFISRGQRTTDAWGGSIIYEPFDPGIGYGRVLSYGRDGKPGGTGPDADLERRFGPSH